MKNKELILNCVSISLYSKGAKITILPLVVNETKSSYTNERRRIAKDKLMKIDSNWLFDHKSYKYFTYCLSTDLGEAVTLLKYHVRELVKSTRIEVEEIYNLLHDLDKTIPVTKIP